jgi:hypothetical protein
MSLNERLSTQIETNMKLLDSLNTEISEKDFKLL